MRRFMYECKTEQEKQELRDYYLETIYHQTIIQNSTLKEIQEQLKEIRQHMDYLDLDEDERKYANEDGSANYDAIIELCGRIEKELDNGRTEM